MIIYETGDALWPVVKTGYRIIPHICNDIGKWGAGFSGAVSREWKDPEDHYKSHFKYAKKGCALGTIQWVFIDPELAVVNMIAQKGVRSKDNPSPICYASLEACLDRLAAGCVGLMGDGNDKKLTIHMPRIGTGLAGGSWDIIGPLIEDNLYDFTVYVYDLEK